MEKITKIITKTFIFIIAILVFIYISLYAFQQSITKEFISSILNDTQTSEILINYSENEKKENYITIKDYISKNLNQIGLDENLIGKDIITNYVENLTDAILADIIYNYLNNEKMVIISNYEEINEISKLLTEKQQKKFETVINNINNEIVKSMDKIFNENKELQLIKNLNNVNLNTILLVIFTIFVITIIISRDKLKTLKSFINVLITLIVLMLLINFTYKYFLSEIIVNMEKYGSSLQIFTNDFINQLNQLWKYLVIILVIFTSIYIISKLISKHFVNKNK